MRKKTFLRATLLAAALVVAGYGVMKAYDYSYARRVNSDDAMLIANIEALTENEGGALQVSECYFEAEPDTLNQTPENGYVCGSGTSMNYIYPCPEFSRSFVRKSPGTCYKK